VVTPFSTHERRACSTLHFSRLSPVPQYEVNTQTVDILYELAECNEARDRDVSLLIEDMKEKAAEYDAEANYLQGVLLETVDISPTSLFSEGTDYLNILVESAMILDTKDTSLASFFCAINDMTSELYATESENREMERELSSLRRKLTRALMLEKQLKEDLKKVKELLEVETAKADSQLQNLEFLKKKSEDLKSEIRDAEVDGTDFLTRHCDGMAQSWLVGPKILVTETSQELPKLQDWRSWTNRATSYYTSVVLLYSCSLPRTSHDQCKGTFSSFTENCFSLDLEQLIH
uniref:HAUS augmin like complex subunit 1 n=1 Tax=Strix occidentalis caurina TaxID=311401 RepID=A0A8D0FQY6_STROC